MKERPIIFAGESVRAILTGRKTQTRRVIKPQPDNPETFGVSPVWGWGVRCWDSKPIPEEKRRFCVHAAFDQGGQRVDRWLPCPYGKPGDYLWVRETWQDYCPIWQGYWCGHGSQSEIQREHRPVYRTDNPVMKPMKWCSPIYMPRWASRTTLEITDIRVQRVQEISEEDANAEGGDVPVAGETSGYRGRFAIRWNVINQKRGFGWDRNRWVWAISFRLLDGREHNERPEVQP